MIHRSLKTILGVVMLSGAVAVTWAHRERTTIVIDTDVALDDVRALSLLLQDPQRKVVAVVTSGGGSSACDGAIRVSRVLETLGHGDVLVGVGSASDLPAPAWRDVAGVLDTPGYNDDRNCEKFPSTAEVVAEVLETTPGTVTWVALGPLTNLAEIVRAFPEALSQIHAVYYAGDEPESAHPGWNTERDRDAAIAVFGYGIPVYVVPTGEVGSWIHFDSSWTDSIADIESPAASLIVRLHRDPKLAQLLEQGHAQAWDDTVALALLAPDAFVSVVVENDPPVFRLKPENPEVLNEAYLAALRQPPAPSPRPNVVLDPYPTSPESFRDDVAPYVAAILERHGAEEWKAAVLTNELHRHLGIYSLVGVKMGIRAREILNASLDDLQVESHAGREPPVSCLTDGLQVSTGASLGRGTIQVVEGDRAAEAVFIGGGTRLRLTLKPVIQERIRADVLKAIQHHGSLTQEYFDEIRRLSIIYWLELDRREIFMETFAKDTP